MTWRPLLILPLALIGSMIPEKPAHAAAAIMAYTGAACSGRDNRKRLEDVLGAPTVGHVEFLDFTDWDKMLSSGVYSMQCWRGITHRVVLSVAPVVKGGDLAKAANGDYDQHYQAIAQMLVDRGQNDAYIRIGWEFNGSWYPWAANKDPEAWKATFRRVAGIFKSTKGGNFQIVWNPNQGTQALAPDKGWPGDDVVDVIGLDVYNRSYDPKQKADPVARWNTLVTQPYGLDWLAKFATEHNKPIALPEWGTGIANDGSGIADDAYFVRQMGAWIANHNVAFQAYWDYPAPDYRGLMSNGEQPNVAAAYREAFGPAPASAGSN